MLPLALLLLLLKLLLPLGQRASSCTFDHLFVCSVAASMCLGVCLLCTRLSTHFSAVHSVFIREVKHDVNGRRQTAKITSHFDFFSSNR